MALLDADFNELLERIRQGRELNYAGFEPVYYLIFEPASILDVKRQIPIWKARLKNQGWTAYQFSMAEQILNILRQTHAPIRKIWTKADAKAPHNWARTNTALSNALANGALQERLEHQLADLGGQAQTILLVTDLEALHPYMRIGAIERQLQGKFTVPTVFFYPGKRTGKTGLKFLGFHHQDGNYRSVHVGG